MFQAVDQDRSEPLIRADGQIAAIRTVARSRQIMTEVFDLAGPGIQRKEIPAVHSGHIEPAVRTGPRNGELIIASMVIIRLVRELEIHILDPQGLRVDPVKVPGP